MFAARVGDLASAKLLVAAGANVNDPDAWGVSATVLAAHSRLRETGRVSARAGRRPERGRRRLFGAARGDHAARRKDGQRAPRPRRRSECAAADVDPDPPLVERFPFGPELVGATPFWLAARFAEAGVMRLLVKHGADPLFVHHAEYHTEEGAEPRTEVTTALMAATGMGRGTPWVQPARGEREALSLEAVKLAIELGVDVNAANAEGRTALDGAKALKYQTVVKYLAEQAAGR